jgi:hypothetical protein
VLSIAKVPYFCGMKYAVVLVFLLSLFASSASCQIRPADSVKNNDIGWKILWNKKGEAKILYDSISLKKMANLRIHFWTKWYPPKDNDSPQSDHILIKYELDCLQEKYRILATVEYDVKGKIISQDDKEEQEWTHIIPSTVGEKMLITLCK